MGVEKALMCIPGLDEFVVQNPWVGTVSWVIIVVLILITIERIVAKSLRGVIRRKNIPQHAGNAILLVARLFIVIIGLGSVLNIAGLPSDWVVAITALSGTAIGLASARTVGNLFAGIWVLVTRPYHVGDYINLSGQEGIVDEITLNYTKLTTPFEESLILSNQEVLNKTIKNYRITEQKPAADNFNQDSSQKVEGKFHKLLKSKVEKYYRYPLLVSFHAQNVSTEKVDQIFQQIRQEFQSQCCKDFQFSPYKIAPVEKGYSIHVSTLKARELFELVPKILQRIMELTDS